MNPTDIATLPADQCFSEVLLPIIAEGKTKVIRELPGHPEHGRLVLIENTDAITAKDGERRRKILGKGRTSAGVTTRIFRLLHAKGIKNHCMEREGLSIGESYFQNIRKRLESSGLKDLYSHTYFFAQWLDMQPFEIVVRRVATGSYLKRNPGVAEGTVFDDLVVEVFYKDDPRHDPLVILDSVNYALIFHNPQVPAIKGFLERKQLTREESLELFRVLSRGQEIAVKTFLVLEEAFRQYNHTLVDMKIEVGKTDEGEVILGDVITPDEIRLWPGGIKKDGADKQLFRDTPDEELTQEMLDELLRRYKNVENIMMGVLGEPDYM